MPNLEMCDLQNNSFNVLGQCLAGYGKGESASSLSPEEQAKLATNLETLTGKTVQVEFETNADLIGGVVTRIGCRIYDGSVRAKLDAYRRQMTGQIRA